MKVTLICATLVALAFPAFAAVNYIPGDAGRFERLPSRTLHSPTQVDPHQDLDQHWNGG